MICETIKKYRECKDLSQAELSRLSNISRSTLSTIENGITENPTHDSMNRIANGLNVSLARLYADDFSRDDEIISSTLLQLTKDEKVEWFEINSDKDNTLISSLITALVKLERGYNLNSLTDMDYVNEYTELKINEIDEIDIISNTVYYKIDNSYFLLTKYDSNFKNNDILLFIVNSRDIELICTDTTFTNLTDLYEEIVGSIGINKKSLIDKLKSL